MIWFVLAILAGAVVFFTWISDAVFPSMWVIGEQFGEGATRGEVLVQKAARACSGMCAVLWWLLLAVAVLA